jgi:SulP family sulfate permease
VVIAKQRTGPMVRIPDLASAVSDLFAGAVVAFVAVSYGLSFSLLLFSGPLADHLSFGISATLISTGLGAIVVALGSSYRFSVAGPYAATMAVMSSMAAGVATQFPEPGDAASMTTHVLFVLVAATLLTGLILFAIGALRLGVWMRYIPYPVVGGFLAAAGWLLTSGAIEIATGHPLSLRSLSRLADPEVFKHLAAGGAFAAAIFVTQSRLRHYLVLPGLLVLGFVVCHASIAWFGIAPAEARAQGWLLSLVQGFEIWWPWSPEVFRQLDWPVLLLHVGEITAAAGVTAISILLGATGLEVSQKTSVDLDREFQANGIANMIVGLFGGTIANLSVNRSVLNVAAGARTRMSGVLSGVMCLAMLFAGTDLIGSIPTPILSGLLLYLGLSVLWEWLIKARGRLSPTDYLLVFAILVLIVNNGYLEGIALGVVASCIFFALSCSRARVIKHNLTRQEYGSYVDRSYEQSRTLRDFGTEIQILWLQGYLFFGTANRLLEEVKGRAQMRHDQPVRYVVLDFRLVSGIDSSAVFSFIKLRNFAEKNRVRLIFCALPPMTHDAFSAEGLLVADDPLVCEFPNLDLALEWAEERVLEERFSGEEGLPAFEAWLGKVMAGDDIAARFLSYLEPLDLQRGDYLFHQGDPADALYLVVSGRVGVMIEQPPARAFRMRSITGYNVVGEMGLYRDTARIASVVAEESCLVLRLTREAFLRMQERDPQVTSAFQSFIIRTLADRVSFATSEIAALQR